MNIEHLSKSQIVLLTLLVSFVTSIATGIVTVSLMDQAPPSVSQTVNRIVERTVEKVVPAGQTASTVVTREKTVVVKEADLISGAVEKLEPSIARLFANASPDASFMGLAIVLDSSGLIASDSAALGESADAVATLADGSRVRAFVTSRDGDAGIAFLRGATTTLEGAPTVWKPATISAGKPSLGQTVIALEGKSVARIAEGIVTAIVPQSYTGASGLVIETNIADPITAGAVLINTSGEIVGMSTLNSRDTHASGFIVSSPLVKELAPVKK